MKENGDLLQKKVNTLISTEKGEDFLKIYLEKMEADKKNAFLDGYRYAIRVLEEGLIDNRQT